MNIQYTNKENTMVVINDINYISTKQLQNSRFRDEYKKFIDDGGVIKPYKTVDEFKEEEFKDRRNKIIALFKRFDIELTAIAIDKVSFANDSAYIESQRKQYEFLYEQAKAGIYSDDLNASIISENETGKARVAYFSLAINKVRSRLLSLLDNGVDISLSLSRLEDFKLIDIDSSGNYFITVDIASQDVVDSLVDSLFVSSSSDS